MTWQCPYAITYSAWFHAALGLHFWPAIGLSWKNLGRPALFCIDTCLSQEETSGALLSETSGESDFAWVDTLPPSWMRQPA